MTEIKNILLIGNTGAGKSTLGNLLVNKNGKFEKVFESAASSVSITKKYQGEELEVDGIKYRIVDTIGLGDTKFLDREVFFELAEAMRNYFKKDGVNQILFVVDKRFTQEALNDLAMLEVVLFDERVTKFTTIVRTNFPEFDNPKACDSDVQDLKDENLELQALLERINPNNIIHTDAPEKNYEGWEEDWLKANKKTWKYLKTKQEEKYMPKGMERLNERIEKHLEGVKAEQAAVQKKIDELKEKIEQEKKQQEETLKLKREAEKRAEEERKLAEAAQKKAEEERKKAEEALKLKQVAQEQVETERKKLDQAIEREREVNKAADAARNNEKLERERREVAWNESQKREGELQRERERLQSRVNDLERNAITAATNDPRKHAFGVLEEYANSSLEFVEGATDIGNKVIPGVGGFAGAAIATTAAVVFSPIAFLKNLFS